MKRPNSTFFVTGDQNFNVRKTRFCPSLQGCLRSDTWQNLFPYHHPFFFISFTFGTVTTNVILSQTTVILPLQRWKTCL